MDLFEYQGKSLYGNYDIAHPNSFLINKIEDLKQGNYYLILEQNNNIISKEFIKL